MDGTAATGIHPERLKANMFPCGTTIAPEIGATIIFYYTNMKFTHTIWKVLSEESYL